MSKSARKRRLEQLKSAAESQKLSRKLEQERQVNLVQTKMLEKELLSMQQHLEGLKAERQRLQETCGEPEDCP
jgi:hypothetical protein